MQKRDYESFSWFYILFCIMFILTGLTIVASSGNLLILRFVESNTKRTQHERYEMEERRRQQVRVVGDRGHIPAALDLTATELAALGSGAAVVRIAQVGDRAASRDTVKTIII